MFIFILPIFNANREFNPITFQFTIPEWCDYQAELLLSGCLAAWVEAVGEVAGAPEDRRWAFEVVAQQGGDAQGPEEAWRTVLPAAR